MDGGNVAQELEVISNDSISESLKQCGDTRPGEVAMTAETVEYRAIEVDGPSIDVEGQVTGNASVGRETARSRAVTGRGARAPLWDTCGDFHAPQRSVPAQDKSNRPGRAGPKSRVNVE